MNTADENSFISKSSGKEKTDLNNEHVQETGKKIFHVLNLNSVSSAIHLKTKLEKAPGILDADINYVSSVALIKYNPGLTNEKKIRKIFHNCGCEIFDEEQIYGKEFLHKTESQQRQRINYLRKKSIIAAIITLPILILSFFFKNILYSGYILWGLSTVVLFYCGSHFFSDTYKQFRYKYLTLEFLVSASTLVAYLFSVFNLILPAFWLQKGIQPHLYFDAASLIILFILFGQYSEKKVTIKLNESVNSLIGLQPQSVRLFTKEKKEEEVLIDTVKKGDIILVNPGERIGIDGTITEGTSLVDESMIHASYMPKEKKPGDKVFAGTINLSGRFLYQAESLTKNTVLSQIIRRVQNAQTGKTSYQKLANRIIKVFIPVVVCIAIAVFFCWQIWGGENKLYNGIQCALSVLIVACPCALGLAIPSVVTTGIAKALSLGIVIKDTKTIETARNINMVVLDKTGTIVDIIPDNVEVYGKKETLYILYSLSKKSTQPFYKSIADHLPDEKEVPIVHFRFRPGLGIEGVTAGKNYHLGVSELIKDKNIDISDEFMEKFGEWSEDGKSVLWFFDENEILSIIALENPVKENSVKGIEELHELGIQTLMISGDNAYVSRIIAKKAGIRNYKPDILPQDKADIIRELQTTGRIVAMAGDSLNDSNGLKQANVSFAVGNTDDNIKNTANITILSGDLSKIPLTIRLSEKIYRVVHENLFWTFIYNFLLIPVAAGIFYPANGFLLCPFLAVIAMIISSFIIMANSSRVKYLK